MSKHQRIETQPAVQDADILDQAHLHHYTMNIPDLAAEVVALFLGQMPETIAAIESASDAAAWRLATHTLKGAASSVGAGRIRALATELEDLGFHGDDPVRLLRIQALKAAAAEFREVAKKLYP